MSCAGKKLLRPSNFWLQGVIPFEHWRKEFGKSRMPARDSTDGRQNEFRSASAQGNRIRKNRSTGARMLVTVTVLSEPSPRINCSVVQFVALNESLYWITWPTLFCETNWNVMFVPLRVTFWITGSAV